MSTKRKVGRGPTLREGLRAELLAAARWSETAVKKAAAAKVEFKKTRKLHRQARKIAKEARRAVKELKKRLKDMAAAVARRRPSRAKVPAKPQRKTVTKGKAAAKMDKRPTEAGSAASRRKTGRRVRRKVELQPAVTVSDGLEFAPSADSVSSPVSELSVPSPRSEKTPGQSPA